MAQLVKNPPAMWETWVRSLGWEDPLEEGKATHSSILGLPGGSAGKESACNVGDVGSIPGLGRSAGGGEGPTPGFWPENPTACIVLGVAKSQTQPSDFHFHFHFLSGSRRLIWLLSTMWETWVPSLGWEDPLEEEMAIHSSTIAWKIPWSEEPGRLQSMRSQRVGYN